LIPVKVVVCSQTILTATYSLHYNLHQAGHEKQNPGETYYSVVTSSLKS
jgi:hypothetical protein